jgi:hypothetical protein
MVSWKLSSLLLLSLRAFTAVADINVRRCARIPMTSMANCSIVPADSRHCAIDQLALTFHPAD